MIVLLLLLIALVVLVADGTPSPPPVHGVMLHSLTDEYDQDMDRDLDAARELGANAVRVDVQWARLEERAKRRYSSAYLGRLDRFVRGAHERGMLVLPSVLGSPCWASTAPESIKQGCSPGARERGALLYPPRAARDYGDVVAWMARRYGSKLLGIEVWNEPNNPGFLRGPDPPRAYAALLKAAYPAIKRAHTDTTVVGGGLSAADRDFLERLYEHGIGPYYDVLSIHPYSGPRGPDALLVDPRYAFRQGISMIRDAQREAEQVKPLWVTEFGWNTSTASDLPAYAQGVSDGTQARHIERAFAWLDWKLDFVEAAFVYNLRDVGTDSGPVEQNFGLLTKDFRRKPSYEVVTDIFGG